MKTKTLEPVTLSACAEFTDAIKTRLAERGMSRLKLAHLMNVHPSFITKILKGDSNISIETFVKISLALDCSFSISVTPNGDPEIGEGSGAAKLLELLQDGGSLPQVTIEASSVSDWQRILMDAHADLTRQLCYYMEDRNEQKVKRCLQQIETICQAWRTKGPTE